MGLSARALLGRSALEVFPAMRHTVGMADTLLQFRQTRAELLFTVLLVLLLIGLASGL